MQARRNERGAGCCGSEGTKRAGMMGRMNCCKVEAVVSVDERGQLVLPKEIRQKAGIKAGEKLAVIMNGPHGRGEVCCISLIKAEGLAESVKSMLGPMMKEIFG
ncbi:MAG: HgcAB-associated protein [Candidatus Krumholzibacteria bacterium]|nr:HgcAB-associated protein [Candidatus Krumholzibacteria bacterium]